MSDLIDRVGKALWDNIELPDEVIHIDMSIPAEAAIREVAKWVEEQAQDTEKRKLAFIAEELKAMCEEAPDVRTEE